MNARRTRGWLFERAMQNCGPECMHVCLRWCETQDRRFLEIMGDWAAEQRIRCLDEGRDREAMDYGRINRESRAALAKRDAFGCLSAA